jgi:hypothetical protein
MAIPIEDTRSVLTEKRYKFKSGCWIIRQWKEDKDVSGLNGEVDFVQFDSRFDKTHFTFNYFYRIDNNSIVKDLTEDAGRGRICTYVDEYQRVKFDFRLASKIEIKICKKLIGIYY